MVYHLLSDHVLVFPVFEWLTLLRFVIQRLLFWTLVRPLCCVLEQDILLLNSFLSTQLCKDEHCSASAEGSHITCAGLVSYPGRVVDSTMYLFLNTMEKGDKNCPHVQWMSHLVLFNSWYFFTTKSQISVVKKTGIAVMKAKWQVCDVTCH